MPWQEGAAWQQQGPRPNRANTLDFYGPQAGQCINSERYRSSRATVSKLWFWQWDIHNTPAKLIHVIELASTAVFCLPRLGILPTSNLVGGSKV